MSNFYRDNPDLRGVVQLLDARHDPTAEDLRMFDLLAEIGLPNVPVKIEGAAFEQNGDEITLKVTIPARGHVLCEVRGK